MINNKLSKIERRQQRRDKDVALGKVRIEGGKNNKFRKVVKRTVSKNRKREIYLRSIGEWREW